MDAPSGSPPSPEDSTLSTSDVDRLVRDHAGTTGARAGDQIGPYRLLGLLGEGGFGEVWLAERREPFVQRVALKVIKPGMDSKAVIARFEQERQALAVMDHPNVAKVLDGGVTPASMGSRPYFVMEHVQGEPITTYCDRHRLTTRQRLELFIPVCEAVQHAHHKGIIHRDIKPSNVLVTVKDSQAVPKVIDFGVAKAINQTLTEKTIFTEQGQLIGTPEYMSPEQAEMGAVDIDTRTDVYSLGVLLYELLSGTLPFDSETLRSAGYEALRKLIREAPIPRPSTRLFSMDVSAGVHIAHSRQDERSRLHDCLRLELDWLPLKAMRKDRLERYQTPSEFGRDIGRFLAGEPVEARPPSSGYRLRKYLTKHSRAVASVWVVLGIVMLLQLGQAARTIDRAANAAVAADVWNWNARSVERRFGALEVRLSQMSPELARQEYLALAVPLIREIGRLSSKLAEETSALPSIVAEYYEDPGGLKSAPDAEIEAIALSFALDKDQTWYPMRMHDPSTDPPALWKPTPSDQLSAAELARRVEGLFAECVILQLPARHFDAAGVSGRTEARYSDFSASRELWKRLLADDRTFAASASQWGGVHPSDKLDAPQLLRLSHAQAIAESLAFPSRDDTYARKKWKLLLFCGATSACGVVWWIRPRPPLLWTLGVMLVVSLSSITYVASYWWLFGMLGSTPVSMIGNAGLLTLPAVSALAISGRWRLLLVVAAIVMVTFLAVVLGQYVPGSRGILNIVFRLL
jgi:serine/threonine protein kinase